MRLRPLVLAPLALAAVLRGQEPLNRPVPLLATPAGPSAGQSTISLEAARRAQELGFSSLAAQLYRGLLAAPGGDRTGLTLALATALLDDNHADQAEQVLRGVPPGQRISAWHLRAGLAAVVQRKLDGARAELGLTHEDQLTAPDRAWFLYLRGRVAEALGDKQEAGSSYRQARQAATTDLQRVRFDLYDQATQLSQGPVSTDAIEQDRRNAQSFRGSPTGHDLERVYAVALYGLGRKADAVAELQREVLTLRTTERARIDDTRLLIGLMDGAADGIGRNALLRLLESGVDVEQQRVALQLLARDSATGAARTSFRAELDQLIDAPTPHPILEDLLLFRAAWALANQPPEYQRAEDDANALLEKFPGSALKADALGVLTASAWDQERYRSAAAAAARQQAETPPGPERAELGVLRAEASFRAGMRQGGGDAVDFSNAADAYAAALRDRPADLPAGDLMFQQVEAEIEIGSLDSLAAAQRLLDGFASDPAFDANHRWQAEANLATALKLKGQTAAAYDRVNRLLQGGGAAALPAELGARMAWQQAELSYDAGQYARALELAAGLRGEVGRACPPASGEEIASSSALLEAQADFALDREAAGVAVLARLRQDFPNSDAAMKSYMIDADRNARQDRITTAQKLYLKLADEFPDNGYAPYAYWQAALLAEKLGRPSDLTQATQWIEKLISLEKAHPAADSRGGLTFDARLKQGDLFEKLNEFPLAQQTYQSLRDNFSQHPNIVYALLALAKCHAAQAQSDPGHVESARDLLEDLVDRADAPVDVRVEAGFSLGNLRASHGDADQAQKAWWRVVTAFLLDPARAPQLGARGRFWVARTLLGLADLAGPAAGQPGAGQAGLAADPFDPPARGRDGPGLPREPRPCRAQALEDPPHEPSRLQPPRQGRPHALGPPRPGRALPRPLHRAGALPAPRPHPLDHLPRRHQEHPGQGPAGRGADCLRGDAGPGRRGGEGGPPARGRRRGQDALLRPGGGGGRAAGPGAAARRDRRDRAGRPADRPPRDRPRDARDLPGLRARGLRDGERALPRALAGAPRRGGRAPPRHPGAPGPSFPQRARAGDRARRGVGRQRDHAVSPH